ncbi:MAG: glycosyltransferase [Mycobacteriales bacterium]
MTTSAGRVLVVGPSKVGDMAWFLALAYRRMGWQVATFDDRAFLSRGLPGTVGKAVWILERDHRVTRRSRQLGQQLRSRARGCDHVVTIKGEYFLPEDVAAVSASVPFVNWHPDHPVLDQHFACIPHYTAFCPKDSWSTQRLRNMGFLNVTTLPHSSDPQVLGGAREEPVVPSFSVVGGMYAYRRHWIDQATGLGLEAQIWGSSLGGSDPAVTARRNRALGPEQGEALRSGCFTLNTHAPKDIAGGNQRLFDAAAAGAPQLTERLPESLRHFSPDSEIATFEDRDEFESQVKELVANAALRQRLARNSYERLCDEHTYEHRVHTILSML